MLDKTKENSKLLDITVLIGEYPLKLVLSRESRVRELWEIVNSHDTLHREYGPIGSKFIALATSDGYEVLDQILTNMTKPLSKLKNRSVLKALYCHGHQSNVVGLHCFQFLKCLGKGLAGSVYLVRSKITGRLFGLKQIEKSYISDYRKFQAILREKKIMTELKDSCHTVRFHSSFQSVCHLNFLLEFYPGGELFFHMKTRKLAEHEVKLYFCELVLGLQHLHKHNILYRDLKPQNVLVDVDGHLCIADFGLSKCGFAPEQITDTICGSPEYMAPDILQRQGYGYEIDFYTLGVILYQFVTGMPPFYNDNIDQLQRDIKFKEPNYHGVDNPDIKVLLKQLLNKDSAHRLSNFPSLKNCIWLKNVDWVSIGQRETRTAFCLEPYKCYIHEEFTVLTQEVEDLNRTTDHQFDPLFQFFNYTRPSSLKLILGESESYSLTSVKLKARKRKCTDSSTGDAQSQMSHYRTSKHSKQNIQHLHSKKKLTPLTSLNSCQPRPQTLVPSSTMSKAKKLTSQSSQKNLMTKVSRIKEGVVTKSPRAGSRSKSKEVNQSLCKTRRQEGKGKPKGDKTKYFKIKLS